MSVSRDAWLARATEGVRDLLRAVGEDPGREGLKKTPARVVRAFREMTQGYEEDPTEILGSAIFEDDRHDELVLLRGVRFTSLCEHHLLAFSGTAAVGYLPGQKGAVAGLSKLARLLDCFARRLQLQERLTQQVARALMAPPLEALAAGVVLRATHSCLSCRGAKKEGAEMVTSAMLGIFRHNPVARAEFFELAGLNR